MPLFPVPISTPSFAASDFIPDSTSLKNWSSWKTIPAIWVFAGDPVVGVGKISDIFAGQGLTRDEHTEGNVDGMRATIELARTQKNGLVFVNLVDFDMLYGHRRDATGYRRAIETFDADLMKLESALRDDDLVLLTADHGNDPTFSATTDHTREYVPIIACGKRVKPGVELGSVIPIGEQPNHRLADKDVEEAPVSVSRVR